MNRVEAALRRAVEDLDELGCAWALVGGLAISARAEPRTTGDVDVVVAVDDDAAAEALIFALTGRGYVVDTTVEQTAADRLATARLHPPGGLRSIYVDILFASSGIEGSIAAAATRIEVVPGLVVPVATVGHLIAMKVLSRNDEERPLDAADLRALVREASDADLAVAHDAVSEIVTRGYNRRRDLVNDLRMLLAGSGRSPVT